jgi:hypothetical protein
MQAAEVKVLAYIEKTRGEAKFQLFGKDVPPFPRDQDECWWFVLLCSKPFRSVFARDGGEQPCISPPDVNKWQTPREECLLMREKLQRFDIDHMLDQSAPERDISVVQVDPSANFLDRSIYTQRRLPVWQLAAYAADHFLVPHDSEVPQFLDYRLNVFGNTVSKCIKLQHRTELRNTPANLLTIDKKSLDAPVDIHGKVFVVAEGRDLTKEELFEIVIFCMGQAETTELKLTSWQKLKAALTEEARKFLMSAQYVRARPRVQC